MIRPTRRDRTEGATFDVVRNPSPGGSVATPASGRKIPRQTEGEHPVSTGESNTPRPVLIAVDDDLDALGKITHELNDRYGTYYRVVCKGSPEAGIRVLRRLKEAGE